MPQVSITVGPRSYAIRCDPGEEDKVVRLGALIDEHYRKLGGARTTSEAQNLVFASLFMADALLEAQAETARLRGLTTVTDDAIMADATQARVAQTLETLATRAERMAEEIEDRTA